MTDRSILNQAASPDDSDAALLERLRSGDSTAFDDLFLRHYAAVYRVLYGVVGNAQEAEDLAQESFTALYRQPPRLEGSGSVGAWLYRVAVNRAYNALRGIQRLQRRLEQVEPEQQSDPQDEYVRREERERVRAALARLPERTAKLLLLRYAGLSYAEIASAIDVAASSVGTLLARAERAFVAEYEQIETAEIRE
jgi:RNA polymerase sigma-70 factor (ECF subfamily)